VDPARIGIIVIDPQPAFASTMANDAAAVNARLVQLYVFADLLQVPLVTTFERPVARKGALSAELEAVFPAHGRRFEKDYFDCCREPEIRKALGAWGPSQVAVAGAETDVCVLQSVLGLLAMGFEVFVLEDCLFSNERNVAPALERMYAAGAVPSTYKTFHFEMVRHVGRHEEDARTGFDERWKRLRPVLRDPYDLPPHPAR
jgi:nicotinamidase-related amidase